MVSQLRLNGSLSRAAVGTRGRGLTAERPHPEPEEAARFVSSPELVRGQPRRPHRVAPHQVALRGAALWAPAFGAAVGPPESPQKGARLGQTLAVLGPAMTGPSGPEHSGFSGPLWLKEPGYQWQDAEG